MFVYFDQVLRPRCLKIEFSCIARIPTSNDTRWEFPAIFFTAFEFEFCSKLFNKITIAIRAGPRLSLLC